MANRKALFLSTIHDLEYCRQHQLHQEYQLFSLHPAIDHYARDLYQIDCKNISEYVPVEFAIQAEPIALKEVSFLMAQLDQHYSDYFENEFGKPLNIFQSLYGYLGFFEYVGMWYLSEALKVIRQEENFSTIRFFSTNPTLLYRTKSTVIDNFLESIKVPFEETITHNFSVPYRTKSEKLSRLWKQSTEFPTELWQKFKCKWKYSLGANKFKIRKERLNVFSFENLYELEVIKDEFLKNVNYLEFDIYDDPLKKYPTPKRRPLELNIENIQLNLEGGSAEASQFLLTLVKENFQLVEDKYLNSLKKFHQFFQDNPIQLAIWGNPPTLHYRSIYYDYLNQNKVPVIGCQHGNISGFIKAERNYYSEFKNTNHYLSFGFDQEDLKECYPEQELSVNIHPVGRTIELPKSSSKKNIDIIYPIANSLSSINLGWDRNVPHEFTNAQGEIIDFLERSNYQSILKPPSISSFNTYAFKHRHASFKNIKVIDYCSLMALFKKYSAKVVIIDVPATPLFDAIMTDSEVFMLNNPTAVIQENAAKLLAKRVHQYDQIDDLLIGVNNFMDGKINPKQDQEFLQQYIQHEGSREKAINTLKELIKSYS